MHIVAKGLLEYETLSGDEIKDLIKGIKPTRDDFDNDINTPKKSITSVPKTGGSATAPANWFNYFTLFIFLHKRHKCLKYLVPMVYGA